MDLLDDIICHICTFLSDYSKISFLSTSTHMDTLKNRVKYTNRRFLSQIIRLWYFDQFTHVFNSDGNRRLPKNVTILHLYLDCHIPNTVERLILLKPNEIIMSHIPPTVSKLTMYRYGDGLGSIPTTITHLRFEPYLNRTENLSKSIPPGVTHLSFGGQFNQRIDLPIGITHLHLGGKFNQSNQFIPASVTHLTFGGHFNQDISGTIGINVVYINFGIEYNQDIKLAHLVNLREIHLYELYNGKIGVPINCKIVKYTERFVTGPDSEYYDTYPLISQIGDRLIVPM